MAEYIEREALIENLNKFAPEHYNALVNTLIKKQPAADVVEVVRCKDCIYAIELDKHCEINRSIYKHCGLCRGDEINNVWHKYKKYYKDYSLVEADDFCSSGERSDT